MLHVSRRRAPGRTLACLLRAAKWVRGQLPVAMEHVPGRTPPNTAHGSRDSTMPHRLHSHDDRWPRRECSSAVVHIMQSKIQRRLLSSL